ncbi:MAG TPA: S8 family serine peptidase [Thermoanaerobaculia bacterium]|nr:S8 family serine peptidase [Thermoanaerobaculia bacterium]
MKRILLSAAQCCFSLLIALYPVALAAAGQQGVAVTTGVDGHGRPVITSTSITEGIDCTGCGNPSPAGLADAPAPKIARNLEARLAANPGRETVRVVVTFTEDLVMPRFPELDRTRPADDIVNVRALEQRARLAGTLLETRRARNAAFERELESEGARVLHRFWIANSVAVEAPLQSIRAIAARNHVQQVELEQTAVPPPTINAGRQVIRSDTFYNMAGYDLTYWRIALLDTGMPINSAGTITHGLFDAGRIRGFDCVNATGSPCTTPRSGLTLNPLDDYWDHGIPSASILTANSALGNDYRGVTRFNVDGYKIYNDAGLHTTAALYAFQAAVVNASDVIVAEIQAHKGSSITTAADNAYDSGVAVIAAAGNYGPDAGTVASPGEAHKAIAVGAVDYATLGTESYQGRGPESDGRVKPEIQGPTNTYTASNAGYWATKPFDGTSGSTPYIGGAATLFGWWINSTGMWVTPGRIYTQLILWGNNFTAPATDNTRGAGLLRHPPPGFGFPGANGTVYLGQSQYYEHSKSISGTGYDLSAALWWPEGAAQAHNNIDLQIIDPSGVVRASSRGTGTVFEKARVSGPLAPGTWKVRMTRGAGGSAGSQQVFFAYYYKESSRFPD